MEVIGWVRWVGTYKARQGGVQNTRNRLYRFLVENEIEQYRCFRISSKADLHIKT